MEQLEIAGFKKEELTIDMAKAQLLSLIYFIPTAILLGLPCYFLWAVGYNLQTIIDMVPARLSGPVSIFTILGVLIVGVVLHELIHGQDHPSKIGFFRNLAVEID